MMTPHPRDWITMHLGRVVRVRRAEGAVEGTSAAQWIVDLELMPGRAPWNNCMVVGARAPVVSTPERPSYALCGTFGGQLYDTWAMPIPWAAAATAALANHVLLDEYEDLAVVVEDGADDGQTFAVRSRPDDDPWLRLNSQLARLRAGTTRLARGAGDGQGGDHVALNADTSPGFAQWAANITEIVNLIVIWGSALTDPTVPLPPIIVPPAPAVLPPTPGGSLATPGDDVPEKGDQGAQSPPAAANGFQAVGDVATGSQTIKGE